ncbi:DUF4011 domain-containing protein [Modestobacter sp. URMC 112]
MGESTGPRHGSPGDVPTDVRVRVDALPVLSWALARAGVPLLSRVTLTSTAGWVRGATVRLTVHTTERPLGDPVEVVTDLGPGPVELGDPGLRLDAGVMADMARSCTGTVEVAVRAGGREVGRAVVPVRVLAADDWLGSPAPLALETLAAHVRPQDPALATLVGAATDLLEGRTGDHPVAAAPSGPARVDERAAAIVEAVRRRGIRLDATPSDWAGTPQRLRTPTEVLDDRLGSCLDTVLVLAAAFEQAGIRPLLWVVAAGAAGRGHAFVGYWRVPGCAASTATTSVEGLVELVESGAVQLVEATMLTADAEPATFGDLHRTPHAAWLTGDRSEVVGVTDVHRARVDGFGPLPVRSVESPPARSTLADGRTADPVEQWQADLLASLQGPALEPVDRLALAAPAGGPAAIADLVAAGAAVDLVPAGRLTGLQPGHAAVSVDVPAGDCPDRLASLAEGAAGPGGHRLVLALGSVLLDADSGLRRAPLLLVPAALTGTPSGGCRLTATGPGRLDPRLVAELHRDWGVRLPLHLAGPADPTGSVEDVLAGLRDALAAADVPATVEPTAELAVVPAAPSRAWADLDEHGEAFARHPVVAALAAVPPPVLPVPRAPALSAPGAPRVAVDGDLDELAATLPLPADSAQLRAVAAATAGRTFALDAAAGTGATQTVANLVARSVADGRRVLVVAGHGRALDDLAGRLSAAGLGPVVGDLRTGAALAPAASPDVPADGADELPALRRRLHDAVRRLHEPNSAGLSLYAARCGVLPADDSPELLLPGSFAANASVRTVGAVRDVLAALPARAAPAEPRAGHPWGFLDRPDVDPVAVQAAVVAVDRAVDGLPAGGPLADVLTRVRTADDLGVLAAVLADLVDGSVPLEVLDETGTAEWSAATDALLRAVNAFCAATHAGLDVALPDALDLPLAELADAGAEAAASGRLGRTKRLAAVLDRLAPVLRADARVAPADVPGLLADLVEIQAAARALAWRAALVSGLGVLPTWNPLADPALVERRVARLRRLGAAAGHPRPFTPALRRFLLTGPTGDPAAVAAVGRVRDAVAGLSPACAAPSDQLAGWAGEDGLLSRWTATRAGRAIDTFGLPSLRAWRELLTGLELLRAAGLDAARSALLQGAVAAEDAVPAFDRGLARASLQERQAAAGRDEAGGQDEAARRFPVASAAARASVRAALAGWSAGAAGDARPEQLPCVLADPESAATWLPAVPELFDVVVVEESGRLAVADAVGALARGRSAVVVGDRHRLPPPSPTSDAPPAESLLDACLRAGLPRLELTWHHRSADEALFALSNAHHSGGRIRTFPSPVGGRPLSLVRVAGTFHRDGSLPGTNPAEARAVVAEVRRRVDGGALSLAVVTLHPGQRALVERLLRDTGDERVGTALDTGALVVAHVDDVTGLARDVVLLSLGCSAPAGGPVPVDLGPLARAGGERWLNAAVTRARRQVVVYASFDPEQLAAGGTSALGVRQLRAYLDLAAGDVDAVPRTGGGPDAHREDVAATLRARGLVVRTDVGLSAFRVDLSVARPGAPGQPVLAVLLDGPGWAARETVTDRDGMPVDVLGRVRGWPAVERVSLGSWLADPGAVADRLGAAVAAAVGPAPAAPPAPLPAAAAVPLLVEPPPVTVPPAAPASTAGATAAAAQSRSAAPVRVTARPAVPPATLAGERPFLPWTPKPAGEPKVFRRLTDPEVARQVRRVLAAGIAAEGPVHRERLARLTAGAFGVARVNEARRESILALLPDPSAEFRWPPGLDPAQWTGFRRQASSAERPLEHVHPDEIGNAMVALCRAGDGMTRDELFARTLAVFGHRRRHPVLLPYLEVALAHAVRASRVTRQPAGNLISAA